MVLPEVHMNTSPFLSIDQSCDVVLQWANNQLIRAGLRTVRTFDLHAARLGMEACPCPNHGKNDCDCQMIILLVYGKTSEPVTLVLHGSNDQTWLSLVNTSSQRVNPTMQASIEQALQIKLSE